MKKSVEEKWWIRQWSYLKNRDAVCEPYEFSFFKKNEVGFLTKQILIKICELFFQGVMKDNAKKSTKERANGGWHCQLLAQAGIIIGKMQIKEIKIKVKEEKEK